MGTNELRKRKIWQDTSGGNAGIAEKKFYEIMLQEFEGSDFRIRSKPREFKDIYSKIKLNKKVLADIYSPDETWTHGVIPDFAIDNIKTKKTLYVEVKRQDGWVERKPRKAGRGNAHERSNKFFTPGLLKILRESGKLGDDVLPFWVVFQGDIARDPKRVREITCWYGEYSAHFFLWHDSVDDKSLISHFNKKLKHLLA
ncbi:restriction endonuclease [Candidatus Falkowbacteria bacterium RIFOXYB2_FULL_38_15]|uniref:Restriction endonuclease n=1 Tax=Candidatus Falkowbacteria bacterium RIFOXYA2_FULL_38_12 TaxID=1797993 RepID=A0A1F5S4V9_9BACT|nr:MAG: restriction endonuclease [Candidatus Falkowbacteria bacterium RIFOXYA2_FULL_38_12]OGF33760.1 MAG: restriction endonuclease [Candidatus Falkowbacteria bacterium RIFOXYB2_FULL_38_15]OGF42371.1 MAG: restriction endonuclease [Candidatus Falkowbacteria bacterium RIFOXYD2_FULL_39_16]